MLNFCLYGANGIGKYFSKYLKKKFKYSVEVVQFGTPYWTLLELHRISKTPE